MRITVDIPGRVYRRLKSQAAKEGHSVRDLILRGVEYVLKEGRRKSRKRIKLPILRSGQPGALKLDNDKIFHIISFP